LLQWPPPSRIDIHAMFLRRVLLLLLLACGGASAGLLNPQGHVARYMQTTEDAAIWAQVGNSVVNVGHVRAGQILAVVPTAADYDEFRFGFGTGFLLIKATLRRFRESSVLKIAWVIYISRSAIKI